MTGAACRGAPPRFRRALLTAAAAVLLLTSCASGVTEPSPSPAATPGPTSTVTPVPTTSPPVDPTSPTATPSECPTDWGIDAKTEPGSTSATLTDVRAGQHDCYDRLVIDIDGDAAGFDVRYVDAVAEEGSGEPVELRGSAFLQVIVRAPAYDPTTGEETYSFSDGEEIVNVSGFESFRQVAWAGSFEGQTVIGLGVESRLPFQVFSLDGPGDGSRVVVDVVH
jgi:ABC-type amino acid transport substrate-binding protein